MPDELKAFLESEAAAGGYEDSAAFVQDVLKTLWRHTAKAALEEKLVSSLEENLPSVEPTPDWWEAMRDRVRRHAEVAQK